MRGWIGKSTERNNKSCRINARPWAFLLNQLRRNQNKRITLFDITVFLRQLATLMSAGVPIIQSCELLEKSQVKSSIRLLIYSIKREMLTGKALYYSLQSHHPYFDELTCQLIKMGEYTGKLDEMLRIIADQQEKNLAFKKHMYQTLFYPCVICVTAFIVTFSMFIFVIPRFADLFQDTQVSLPLLTRCIFYFSAQLQQHLFLLLLPVMAGILAFFHPALSSHLKHRVRQFFIRFPPIRQCLHKIFLARFARNLAMTFAAGMPINEALKLAADASESAEGSTVWAEKLRRHINSGLPLHHAMETLRYFPELMIQMTKIGEESGMLVNMLHKAADFLEADINQLINHLNQLLEPLIMLGLGVLIGGLVIGMYLPIFKLGNAL
jgi:type IV pilus assembly protein PilC